MRTLFPLLCLFLYSSIAFGQVWTKEQAKQLAQQLNSEKILSEKGMTILKEVIEDKALSRPHTISPMGIKFDFSADLTNAQFLLFLQQAFTNDYYYRVGGLEQERLLKQYMDTHKIKNFDEKSYAAYQAYAEEQMKNFAGRKLEEAIADEESFPPDSPAYSMSSFGSPTEYATQWVHPERSVMGKTASRTLADLLRLKLIDQTTYEEAMLKVENKEMVLENQLIGFVFSKTSYLEDFEKNKAAELAFLQKLKDNELLTEAKHQQVLSSYKDKELKDRFEILNYCEQVQVFVRDKYPEDISTAYRGIFEDIRAILPEFNFTNFDFSTQEEEENVAGRKLIEQDATISFEMEGQKYQHNFVHNLLEKQEDGSIKNALGEPRVNPEFHQGINKWLKEQNSDKRLYYTHEKAKRTEENANDFALLLLSEEQFKIWETSDRDNFLSPQNHDNTFNSINISQLITQYEELGFFAGLSPDEMKKAKASVEQRDIDAYQDILMCFPNTIVYFDMEGGAANAPYKTLCESLKKASRGAFAPSNIVDEHSLKRDTTPSLFAFDLKEKTYQHELVKNGEWLDMSIFSTINKVMRKSEIEGGFYRCISGWQMTGYIFLTDEQRKNLKAKQPKFFSKEMMKLGAD